MFSFSSEIMCCVSGYQMKAWINCKFLKIALFLANKREFTIKIKKN